MIPAAMLIALALAADVASAQSAAPPGAGDPQRGEALVTKDCDGCHVRRFGDRDAAYTRLDRRVQSLAQLRSQVAACNSQLGAGLFPDEEEDIVAYLDGRYYKFGDAK
jgi:mono/diheme cytochrome c family protein